MELDKLLAAVGVSVHQAQQILDNNSVAQYFGYYERISQPVPANSSILDGDHGETVDCWVPKIEQVVIPKGHGKQTQLDVPVVALINHNSLDLEEVNQSAGQLTGGPPQ